MAQRNERPLILNESDFQGITVKPRLKNLTSGTAEIGPKGVDLLELGDRQLVLSAPRGFCANGHQIGITLVVNAPRREEIEIALRATAKVISTETGGKSTDAVALKLVQYRDEEWNLFEGVFAGRQAEIIEFFKAVKGED